MTEPIRYIFLDIDGVLHPNGIARTYVRRGLAGEFIGHRVLGDGLWQWSDPFIELLRDLSDVRVVVHSTWREMISLDDIRAHMPSGLGDRVVDITPRDISGRFESIREYCAQHGIDRYVIVDDAVHEFPKGLAELVACGDGGLGDSDTVAHLRKKLAGL